MPNAEEIKALLTGPRAAFEVVTESVNGVEMLVYKERMKALREISRLAMNRGPDNIFLVYGNERISYPEFIKRADVIGESFSRFGVNKGDRIAVLSANNPQWCLAFWATVDSAAVLVGLNGWWKSDEIVYGLNQSGSKILIADSNRFKRIAGNLEELAALEYIFIVDPTDEDLKCDPRVHSFEELENPLGEPVDNPLERVIDEDDPAVIFYTSGTTGRPKGAVSTHRSMIANLQNSFYAAVAGALANPGKGIMPNSGTSQLSSLLTSPLFHVSGCHSGLVVALASGMKLVIPVGKLDPEKILRIIQEERINLWTGVPTVVWRVVEEAGNYSYDLTSLMSVAYGGSPSGADLMKRVKDTFPNVKAMGNGYGLTESSSIATINSGDDLEMHPDSVGRTLPVVELAIVDESGKFLDKGKTGEVWIKGPIIMPGYWENKEATDDIISDGWLHSGDVGYVDESGLLFITDRAKDMIIRVGENVYCVEIENRLVEHPLIAEAAVIGVSHPILGEEVKAIVHQEPGANLSAEEIKAWVRETLADFKVPEYVEITDQYLPRNPSGKILKNVLRGQGAVSFDAMEMKDAAEFGSN